MTEHDHSVSGYSISVNNLHIYRSYRYKASQMQSFLEMVHINYPHSNVWIRDYRSLKAEWMVHNALYRLHILRSRTADVDLNYPNHFEWAYIMLAPLARLIIK